VHVCGVLLPVHKLVLVHPWYPAKVAHHVHPVALALHVSQVVYVVRHVSAVEQLVTDFVPPEHVKLVPQTDVTEPWHHEQLAVELVQLSHVERVGHVGQTVGVAVPDGQVEPCG